MLVKDLIRTLQEMLEQHEPHKSVLGELDIVVDVFGKDPNTGQFVYKGFSQDIRIDKSSDGVYDIISGFENQNP